MKNYIMMLLMLVSATSWAQPDSSKVNQMSVGLDFMTHGEACGGGMPRTDTDDLEKEDLSRFLLGRTRVKVDYRRSGLQAYAVIQNKAVWGANGNQTLNLYEGWVKMTAKNGLFAQLGRVALAYDDERIIGTNDFAVASKSHDAALMGYEGHGRKAHVILAYNQNSENVYNGTYYVDGAQPYKTMQTVWYHYDVPEFPLGVSLLFMNMGLQAGTNNVTDWNYKTNSPHTVYQQMLYHYMAVATKVSDLDRSLGHCVDLQASYQFSKDIALSVGFTQMMGTETMDRLKQGDSSQQARWGWFSLVVSPNLFTTKW